MTFAVRRTAAFLLPLLVLPAAAQAAPKIAKITSSNAALVARDGKVMPAVADMPLYQGDKVMTRANGSATVSFGNQSLRLGNSSMLPMSGKPAVLSMNGFSSFPGGDYRREFLRRLAEFRRLVRDFRCRLHGFPHLQQAGFGFGFGQDFGDDGDRHRNDRGRGHHHHGNGNGNGHKPCPPVSP